MTQEHHDALLERPPCRVTTLRRSNAFVEDIGSTLPLGARSEVLQRVLKSGEWHVEKHVARLQPRAGRQIKSFHVSADLVDVVIVDRPLYGGRDAQKVSRSMLKVSRLQFHDDSTIRAWGNRLHFARDLQSYETLETRCVRQHHDE